MDPIADLIQSIAAWRATEQAAAQDVEDADARVIAMDLRFQEAKRRHKLVEAKVRQLQMELAQAVDERTAPPEIIYLTDTAR